MLLRDQRALRRQSLLARSAPASLRRGVQTLALWVLVTYGENLAITTSKIFAPVRA